MKKILLIGDSIRLSYQPAVADRIKDSAVVTGPEENGRFSAYTLFNLPSYAPDDPYDVIQWNNGQWDTCYMPDGKIHTSLPTYLELQQRIAGILREKTKRLIFATTTPVRPEQFESGAVHPRRNEDIRAYNSAVADRLAPLGVETIDLHAPVAEDMERYISEDMVHLSEAGVNRCADLVAAKLKNKAD